MTAMLRNALPYRVNRLLFGDRKRFGIVAPLSDPDWHRWLKNYPEIYSTTQRSKWLFSAVNDAGYKSLARFDLTGLSVAELGPGKCYHFRFLKTTPALYTALDISEDFLESARAECQSRNIPFQARKTSFQDIHIPLPDASTDIFLSYYSLEHIQRLPLVLDEIFRILKPGGRLIGAIPTEGGLAWGAGRWLTTRRTLRDRFGFDTVKMICWEHPNFVDEIIRELRKRSTLQTSNWPMPLLPLDLNLLVLFSAQK